MAKKEEAVIEVKADTSQLDAAFEKSENAVKDLGKAGEESIGLLDDVTGGWASKLVKARAGIGTLIQGLNLTKVALIATGLGAFVVVLGSLIAYFTQTKRGSELLAQGMAALKGVFGVLTDTVAKLGEYIVGAFRNPQQAIKDFADTLKKYVTDKIEGILDGFGLVGEAIKKLFAGDVKGALESGGQAAQKFIENSTPMGDIVKITGALADGFGDVASAAADAAAKAAELEKAQQRLADLQRETLVLTAKERAEIKALNLIAEDTTKSIDERIRAAEKAGAKERELFNRRKREAEEALRIAQKQAELSDSGKEELQALAELEADVYNLQAESLELQTTLQNKVNSLRQEGVRKVQEQRAAEATAKAEREKEAAEEAARLEAINQKRIDDARALEEELNQIGETETERAVRQAEELYSRRLELAGTNAELLKAVEEQFAADILAIEAKSLADRAAQDKAAQDAQDAADAAARAKDLQAEADLQNAKKELVFNVMAAIDALAQIYNNGDEKRARRSFQISKALGIAAATMKTYEAVADALAKDAVPGVPGSRFAAAVAAGLTGLAQVAGIARQQFNPGGASSASSPSVTTPTATPAPGFFPASNVDNSGFRAYVVGSEVSNQMQASQRLKERVALFN